MEMNTESKTAGKLTWIGGILVVVAVVLTTTMSWLLYRYTVNLLTDNLRQRLLSITITQAANLDYKDLNELQHEADWKKPQWTKIVHQLKSAKDTNENIVFMYIFRKTKSDPSQMEFVADAESMNPYANLDNDPTNDVDANRDGTIEPDGADKLQWPGQPYPEAVDIAETLEAYNGPITAKELYEDSYGQVLSGYAPIKDKDGNTVAVLATDIKAGDFFTVTQQTLFPFLLFILFLILAITVLAFALIKIWNRRVELFAELDRQKDELLSIVSHQLATPATSINYYLEMMQEGDVGDLSKEQKEHIAGAQSIGTKLVDLIGMILDVARIQLGKMKVEKQPLDLAEFMKGLILTIEPRAKEKKQNFVYSIPSQFPAAKLDKRLMTMTLENLLSNAVKYTPEKGTVEFTVTVKDNHMFCVVKDTGCGIPEKDKAHMFSKLYRASNVRNTIEGNGFGLYVAKGAVESQGGSIRFESEEGKGTTFYVEYILN
jgi:signal transduction histidine kinase